MPRLRLAALFLGAALLICASSASAHRWRAPVFGPHAHPYGQSYGEWGADWWTWALTQPADVNPMLDTTGENCAQGQRGRVWFLAGTFFGDPPAVSRTCTVPRGKALLFPVLNGFSGATKGDPENEKTEAFHRNRVVSQMRAVSGLHATIDGVAVRHIKARYFEQSPIFKVVLPDNNLFDLNRDCLPASVEAGCEVFPTVDAGYYLMVKPLRRGRHTIAFGGSGTQPAPFTVDATYKITVTGHGH